MIYCFTVPCAQALDLLPTDYEAYRYLAAGGYIAVAACVAATLLPAGRSRRYAFLTAACSLSLVVLIAVWLELPWLHASDELSELHVAAATAPANGTQPVFLAPLCEFSRRRSLRRLFLYGDSIVGQMCTATRLCDRRQPARSLNQTHGCFRREHAMFYYRVLPLNLHHCGGPIALHMSHTVSPRCDARELYRRWTPTANDVLVVQLGAHFAASPGDLDRLRVESGEVATHMAAAFPGTVFWIDPFPQHFEHGDWRSQNDSAPTSRCFPMDPSRHAHQFGRVEVVRDIVRGLRSRKEAVRHVPVYEILSPRWQDHPGSVRVGQRTKTDCTHFGRASYERVWEALLAAEETQSNESA